MRTYLVYAVIIIGLLAVWFLLRPQPVQAPSADTATTTATSTAPAAVSSSGSPRPPQAKTPMPAGPTPLQSLQSVVRGMGNTNCTYEQVSSGSTVRSSNALFIAGGKIRGEFRSRDSGSTGTNTIMLFDGSTLYTWTEGMANGTKTSVKSAADVAMLLPKSLAGDKVLGANLDNVSWDCHPWIPDVAMFKLPAGIAFK